MDRGELLDRALGVVVVGGEEDVERLPGDLALNERAGEVVLNALTTLAPGTVAAISCATEPASIVSGSKVDVSTGLVISTTTLPSSWSP
jgi:hypothetical protein